jgi:hypothetical protein
MVLINKYAIYMLKNEQIGNLNIFTDADCSGSQQLNWKIYTLKI